MFTALKRICSQVIYRDIFLIKNDPVKGLTYTLKSVYYAHSRERSCITQDVEAGFMSLQANDGQPGQ